jgi:hypothetical protein
MLQVARSRSRSRLLLQQVEWPRGPAPGCAPHPWGSSRAISRARAPVPPPTSQTRESAPRSTQVGQQHHPQLHRRGTEPRRRAQRPPSGRPGVHEIPAEGPACESGSRGIGCPRSSGHNPYRISDLPGPAEAAALQPGRRSTVIDRAPRAPAGESPGVGQQGFGGDAIGSASAQRHRAALRARQASARGQRRLRPPGAGAAALTGR